MKRTALVLLALPFALVPGTPAYAGGGCFEQGPAVLAETRTIVIDHACFGTGAAHVAAGAPVTWRNASDLDHNLSGPGIELAELPAHGTRTLTFAKPGLYPYACTLHPGMSAVLVVGPAAALNAPVAAPAAEVSAQPVAVAHTSSSANGAGLGWLAVAAVVVAAGAVLTSIARRPATPRA
jgi:plastocyanin